jgi:hypothetical protein
MWLTTITQAYTTQNFGAGRGKDTEKSALQIFGRPHQWKRYVLNRSIASSSESQVIHTS